MSKPEFIDFTKPGVTKEPNPDTATTPTVEPPMPVSDLGVLDTGLSLDEYKARLLPKLAAIVNTCGLDSQDVKKVLGRITEVMYE